MAFNRRTYWANKYAEMAREALGNAREYKLKQADDLVRACAKAARAYHDLAMAYRK